MSDLAAVAMAVSAAVGAWAARPVPLWVAALAGAVAVVRHWPMVLWLAVALGASGLATRSWAGLHPTTIGPWSGRVTLVTDPAPDGLGASGGLRFVARLGGKRLEADVRGPPKSAVVDRLAGEQLDVTGGVSALAQLPTAARRQLAARHVAGRLTVHAVHRVRRATGASALANGVRRLLVRGATSMPADRRALFTGFVLGDDRGQRDDVVADFRASGLAHLLVVSGENVAFVIALAGPLLRRLAFASRLLVALAVLGLFGVLTRWEPSVLRAEAMAAIALVAVVLGRPTSAIRLVALAVTALLLVDPLLVGSVGFQLSVGASVGIALLAEPLADALPGPRPIALALAVTVAAQVGVAPTFLPAFGGLPVATLPANLLALPAAGPVMMWGLGAGVPAGLVGGRAAALLHAPTSLAIAWIARVASVAARLPLGRLGWPHVLVLTAAAVTMVWAAGPRARPHLTRRRRVAAAAAGVVAAATLAQPAMSLAMARPTTRAHQLTRRVVMWRVAGAVVVLVERARPADALTSLREAAVGRVDLLLVGPGGAATADAVRGSIPVTAMEQAADGDAFVVGGATVRVSGNGAHVAVTVTSDRGR